MPDGDPRIIGKDTKLYTSLEEANKEYLAVCESWYKLAAEAALSTNKISHWMKEPPMLIELAPTVLSPKTKDCFDQIKKAYVQYLDASETIKKDMKQLITQAEDNYKNTIGDVLGA